MNATQGWRVMVLAGGPDRERPVSLVSGAQVVEALRHAGHEVTLADANPHDLGAIDGFRGDVIFPVFHGGWGEGGGVQRILDERGLCYVGCRAPAAALCMDKIESKLLARRAGIETAAFERVSRGDRPTLDPPLVIKPIREGSSIHMAICRTAAERDEAWETLSQHYPAMLVEQYIAGTELTVGVLGTGASATALPVIQILPATAYYDYQAKYERDDTRYSFDFDPRLCAQAREMALAFYRTAGCRHLARVDFLVGDGRPWFLEINTLPGFTTHSLLPMAARRAGMTMAQLVDRLVQMAMTQDPAPPPSH